jgi:hypothetical protein
MRGNAAKDALRAVPQERYKKRFYVAECGDDILFVVSNPPYALWVL